MPAPSFAGETADAIAERVERELGRLRAARPRLAERISRAENILVTHLSCRRQRVIRVRVDSDGRRGSIFAFALAYPRHLASSAPLRSP